MNYDKIYIVRAGNRVLIRCPSNRTYNDKLTIPDAGLAEVTPEDILSAARYYIVHDMKKSVVLFTFVYLERLDGGRSVKAGAA
jgi:hypothetical protein